MSFAFPRIGNVMSSWSNHALMSKSSVDLRFQAVNKSKVVLLPYSCGRRVIYPVALVVSKTNLTSSQFVKDIFLIIFMINYGIVRQLSNQNL